MPSGSSVHVYWNYLLLVPLALFAGAALDALGQRIGEHRTVVLPLLGALALLTGCSLRTTVACGG